MKIVPDPRSPREKKHDLAEMLTYLVAAYICGRTSLRRCVAWSKRKIKWLRKGMALKNGIASVATISRLLSKIDEELFIYAFIEWIGEILQTKGLHIAIDGKAIKAAASKVGGGKTPMILSAVDAATGLILAQLPIQNKECEITKIPELLNLLDIQGSIITIDAIGTQTSIMRQINDSGGCFLLSVKANQPGAYEELSQLFEEAAKDCRKSITIPGFQSPYGHLQDKLDRDETFERNRDRDEYRKCVVCSDVSYLSKTEKEWPFIQTIGCIRTTRILEILDENGKDITPSPEEFRRNGTRRQPKPSSGISKSDDIQTVYVVTNKKMTAKEMQKCRRDHWSVENRLHHVLDDTFREDRSPAKGSKNNLALIRKFAYNILRIMRIQHSVKESLPEVMDLFADSLELLHKYIFEGITPIN